MASEHRPSGQNHQAWAGCQPGDGVWEGRNHLLEDADGDLGGVDEAASSVPCTWKLFGNAGTGGDTGETALPQVHYTRLLGQERMAHV